jgi:hypothetical protein
MSEALASAAKVYRRRAQQTSDSEAESQKGTPRSSRTPRRFAKSTEEKRNRSENIRAGFT